MTLISVGCVALLAGFAPPPAPEPAVREVTVQTPYGSKTYYYLPADASPQMRAAYKARELAERGVVIVEQTQELKLATLWTERRTEAYRSNTAQTRFSSGAGVLPFPPGTAPLVYPNAPAVGPTGNLFNPGGFGLGGFGLGGNGWRDGFLATELTRTGNLPEPLLGAALTLALAERSPADKPGDAVVRFQKTLTTLLAIERMNDPTQRALDRMVDAEQRSNEQLRQYLDGKRKPDGPTATTPAKKALPAENKGDSVLDAAIRQEQSARQREQEAFDRYQWAEPSGRDEAKQAWERACKECDDARALLKVAREQAVERPK